MDESVDQSAFISGDASGVQEQTDQQYGILLDVAKKQRPLAIRGSSANLGRVFTSLAVGLFRIERGYCRGLRLDQSVTASTP